jgi:Astacin (Peptidase family M12A)
MVTARQGDNQTDLLFIDGNGIVNVMWAQGGGAWAGPVGLTAPGTAQPLGGLATVRQGDNQVDLFFVDVNGGLNVMWVIDGGAWSAPVAFDPNQYVAGSLIHELGHALGLYHEHQRPDSGAFVTIAGGAPPNYGTVTGAAPLGPYDCGSIMHYRPSATTPTLTVNNPLTCLNVGQRVAPSAEDFAAADYIYGRVTVRGKRSGRRPARRVRGGPVRSGRGEMGVGAGCLAGGGRDQRAELGRTGAAADDGPADR